MIAKSHGRVAREETETHDRSAGGGTATAPRANNGKGVTIEPPGTKGSDRWQKIRKALVNFHGSRAGSRGVVGLDRTKTGDVESADEQWIRSKPYPIDCTRLDAERGAQPSRLRTETGEMTDSDSSVAIGLHVVDDAGRVGRTAEMLDEALARRGNQPWIGAAIRSSL